MQLSSRFASRSPVLRADHPLSDEQIRTVAPSIFAEDKHESRSDRYRYIATGAVLSKVRKEGFQPFMVCQTRVRDEGKREHTKHMVRLRHADQINGAEANEIILLNSHDGTSSYQMLAGMFRFVCKNGLVCGDTVADLRIPHKGDVVGQVIEGAYDVLDGFDLVRERRDEMRAITLDRGEAEVFAHAALTLKYDDPATPAPITESQLLMPRRPIGTPRRDARHYAGRGRGRSVRPCGADPQVRRPGYTRANHRIAIADAAPPDRNAATRCAPLRWTGARPKCSPMRR